MTKMKDQPILPFASGDWRVEPRGSVGPALAEARRRCALSIEDVAAETRVPVRYLNAIEDERFDVIPGVIYIKGFVRAFARAVGLCEDWAMQAINALLADRRAATA